MWLIGAGFFFWARSLSFLLSRLLIGRISILMPANNVSSSFCLRNFSSSLSLSPSRSLSGTHTHKPRCCRFGGLAFAGKRSLWIAETLYECHKFKSTFAKSRDTSECHRIHRKFGGYVACKWAAMVFMLANGRARNNITFVCDDENARISTSSATWHRESPNNDRNACDWGEWWRRWVQPV